MSDWNLSKKKTVKRSIDLESEFVGKPVSPKKKKDKEPDLTDEIRKFLDEEITLEKINYMCLRMEGKFANKNSKNSIKIYAMLRRQDWYDFFISMRINDVRCYQFLTSISWFSLDFLNKEHLDKSMLKQSLRHKIYEWLSNHPEACKRID